VRSADARVDAVVAGGGPAGVAAAIVLARAGRSVLLCEAGDGSSRKVGEALPPGARPLLRDLGLLERVEGGGHLPSYGNLAAWGDEEPYAVDFLFDPNGHGWHVDRVALEAALRDAARDAGAEVALRTPARLTAGPSPWRLDCGGRSVDARAFVDATGRRAALARVLGARRRRLDRLVALHATVPARDPRDADARTILRGVEDGWWYAALVPGGRRVVAFLTDADLVRPELRTARGFAAALEKTELIAVPARPDGPPATTAAHGALLSAFAGEGWAAAGDAAIACDPLSSQGMVTALYTGQSAGRAVDGWLAGDADALLAHARRVAPVAAAYDHNRRQGYAFEWRWRDRPFWARRVNLVTSGGFAGKGSGGSPMPPEP
jgi:flavin-dependent dehydrogenase